MPASAPRRRPHVDRGGTYQVLRDSNEVCRILVYHPHGGWLARIVSLGYWVSAGDCSEVVDAALRRVAPGQTVRLWTEARQDGWTLKRVEANQ